MALISFNTNNYERIAPKAERGFTPSLQQQAIFDWVENGCGSAIVEAVAGSGKTTTLIHALEKMQGNVFFGAFNKKIVMDITSKLMARGVDTKRVRISTLHAAGLSTWNFHSGRKAIVNQYKVNDIIKEAEGFPLAYDSFVISLVSLVKQCGMGITVDVSDRQNWIDIVDHYTIDDKLTEHESVEYGIDLAYDILHRSIKKDYEQIDMDDMLFSPIYHNAKFFQVDWVVIDEAQDTNVLRRIMAERMLKPGGRLIAVGDRRQSIYGFTGAGHNSMDKIKERFDCSEMPLTVTYRCPKSVVTEARKIVSHISAHDTAPDGYVETVDYDSILEHTPKSDSAILCRITAPLVKLAFTYIRSGVACKIEGRDIGKGLISLIKKHKVSKNPALIAKLDEQYDNELLKASGNPKKEAKLAQLEDRINTIKVLCDGQSSRGKNDVNSLISLIESMFSDDISGILTLSTVHKAKGREWPTVYILGREQFMPLTYAKLDWQKLQEKNIIYVAITRAKENLFYVNNVPKNEDKKQGLQNKEDSVEDDE